MKRQAHRQPKRAIAFCVKPLNCKRLADQPELINGHKCERWAPSGGVVFLSPFSKDDMGRNNDMKGSQRLYP